MIVGTPARRAAIRASLEAACEVTALLGGELAAALGWTYPRDAHQRVVAWLAARPI